MGHKNKVEAILFSSGRKMSIEEISKLSRSKPEKVKQALEELKQQYDEIDSALMLVDEGDKWKFTVREKHLPVVRKIVTETELNRAILETLAVIAFKYPVKQSEVVKIRNNKAYDHIKELEEAGYITRQKYGRTKLIKLTQKFFDYFDLPEEKLKDKFETFEGLAKAIEGKEKEIEEMEEDKKEEQEESEEKLKEKTQEQERKKVETYEGKKVTPVVETTESEITEDKEQLGNLDVYESPEDKEESKEVQAEEQYKEENQKEGDRDEDTVEKQKIQQPEADISGKEKFPGEGTAGRMQEKIKEQEMREKEEVDLNNLRSEGIKIKSEEDKMAERIEKKIEEKVDDLLSGEEDEDEKGKD